MIKHITLILTGIIAVFAIFNMHNLYAYYWEVENATVTLTNCMSDCELQGTYSIEPWTGNHIIESANGSLIKLKGEDVSVIKYPDNQTP